MHESHYNFKSQKQPVFLAPEKSAFCLACAYTGAVKASFDKSLWYSLMFSVAKKVCVQHLIWGSNLVRIQKVVGYEGSPVSSRDYHNASLLKFGKIIA